MSCGVHLGDYGTLFRFTVVDENEAVVDLSGMTVVVRFRKPSSATIERSPVVSAPTTGVVEYTLVDGDIDETGVWRAEVVIELAPGKRWTSCRVDFDVKDNIG